MSKIAFLFPGQGAQAVGMGKDFFDQYPTARQTFEEADDILRRSLSKIVFEGPHELLTQTHNSQPAIYVTSIAIWRVIGEQFPDLVPAACAGHSLGEHSALTATGKVAFADCIQLVQTRGKLMVQACEAHPGAMAAIIGLDTEQVEQLVAAVGGDLWAANFNSPGQVVVSGTNAAIAKACELAKERGARRALPLQVHGAFHSGLMSSAEEALAPYIAQTTMTETDIPIVMNVTAAFTSDIDTIKENLKRQVCKPVLWEQTAKTLLDKGILKGLEIGPGRVLTGLNKRCGLEGTNVEKVADLAHIEALLATTES